MWTRNCLFLVVCLAGFALVANLLLRREHLRQPPQLTQPSDDLQQSLAGLNAEFHEHWQSRGLDVAPAADHLTVARRLSLALAGTVPSLEEIRALEQTPPADRLNWQLARLLSDRRFADYWAERLARIYVGNDQGAFILFRRRRFAQWL